MIVKNTLLGVGITNASKEEVLEYITTSLGKKGKNFYIVTPNPEIVVYANKHKTFKDLLNAADVAVNDGVGLTWASRFLGIPLKHRVTGTDLLQAICAHVADRPITVGFLGARPGIAERTAECLLAMYPSLKIVFVGSEWSEEGFVLKNELRSKNYEVWKDKNHNSKFKIHNSIDILFVAFGFPKQEEWMAAHLDKGIFRVAMGVGGAFDYIAGVVPRAPIALRSFGLEWLFRLVRQPWRIKRQLALIEFVWLVLREKFK